MTKKTIYIASGVVIAGAVTYFIIHNQMNKAKLQRINNILDGKDINEGKSTTGKPATPELPDAKFPLKVGSYGKQVKQLQERLNAKYGSNLTTDGKFGDATVDVLCKNFYSLCFSTTQGRLYTISQTDFDKIMNS